MFCASTTRSGHPLRGPLFPTIFSILISLLLPGCKLVEIKVPGEPLSKRDHALRFETRAFALDFAASIQVCADEIARQHPDPQAAIDVVRWKIGAIGAVRQAAFHPSPTAALVDTWTFCRQMREFFDHEAGARFFGAAHPIALTNALAQEQRIEAIAGILLSSSEWKRMKTFVAEEARAFPLRDLAFERENAKARWEQAAGRTNVPPTGTTADALSDLSDRLYIMSDQIPTEVRWRLSLESQRLDSALADTQETLRKLDAGLRHIGETASTAPGAISNAVIELRGAVVPALEGFQKQWGSTLETLTRERAALARDIATEREAVVQAVTQQRAAVMKDVERMAAEIAGRSMQEARGMVQDVLRYGVLLALIVLGLPFAFGFLSGRIWTRARRGAPVP